VPEIRDRRKHNRKRLSTSCRLCSNCVSPPIRKDGLEDHTEQDDIGIFDIDTAAGKGMLY